MNFEEIVQTFQRAKMLVRSVATRGLRVAVVTESKAEPVVLGTSSAQQVERFTDLMQDCGYQPVALGQRAEVIGFDILFVPAGRVSSVLAAL